MKRNEYVKLAARSFVSLCDLAAALEASRFEHPPVDLVAGVVGEVHCLWELLVWSDGSLNEHECAVFDAVAELAEETGGYRLASVPTQSLDCDSRQTPGFLRVAALCGGEHGPRLAGRMINHLEAFGYGLLAADREIEERELASLQGYIRRLRSEVVAIRIAANPSA